jgi:hypothetical protein
MWPVSESVSLSLTLSLNLSFFLYFMLVHWLVYSLLLMLSLSVLIGHRHVSMDLHSTKKSKFDTEKFVHNSTHCSSGRLKQTWLKKQRVGLNLRTVTIKTCHWEQWQLAPVD